MVVRTSVRVRYEETDRMGVAYYSNYLVWFELGRTAFLRSAGIPYRELEDRYDCILPVVEAHCRYRRSVGYDDEVFINTWISGVRSRGLTFHYLLERDGEEVARGFTKHVVVDRKGRVKSFPESVYKLLKRMENEDSEARRG